MIKRVFSGVQPTGNLHLGNYLGAIKQFAEAQDASAQNFFCVVDLHAITTKHDPKTLNQNVLEVAAAYLASGIDDRSTIFVQSRVSAHSELQWLLSNVARMGWLERMTQYREKTNSVPPADLRDALERVKKALTGSNPDFPARLPLRNGIGPDLKTHIVEQPTMFNYNDVLAMYDMLSRALSNQESASVGLFTYPVLMAADILAYGTTHVPVGKDQIQHINLAREIARKLNKDFGTSLPVPLPVMVSEGAKIMSLRDGSRKMSKSDPDDNSRINLSDSNDLILTKVKKATADTAPFPEMDSDDLKPEINNFVSIYSACSGQPRQAIFDEFAGKGWGIFKPALAEQIIEVVGPIRDGMQRYLKDDRKALIDRLNIGNGVADITAKQVLVTVKDAMGFGPLV